MKIKLKQVMASLGLLIIAVFCVFLNQKVYAEESVEYDENIQSENIVISGTCGNDLSYVLNDEGILTISGTGGMYFDSTENPQNIPWYEYRDSIRYVNIQEGVTTISPWAFKDNQNLISVSISSTVEGLGNYVNDVFEGCTSLEKINVSSENIKYASLNGVLYSKDGTRLYTYPAGKDNSTYEIPDQVIYIEIEAFFKCSYLTSIIIPENVATIGSCAFGHCVNLLEIYFKGNAPKINRADYMESALFSSTSGNGNVTAYYPAKNSTWTEEIMERFSGECDVIWVPFNLEPVNLIDCTITLSQSSYSYTGKALEPDVIVTHGSDKLINGIDYTVVYSDNINAGIATVTITGISNYVGTVTKNFTINKADQIINSDISTIDIEIDDSVKITASSQGKISYSSDNVNVATVSSSGIVTGKGAGTAIITIFAAENDNYIAATKTISVTVSLAVPEITSVTNSSKGVKIKWNPVTGASKYRIFHKTSGGKWKKVGETMSTSYIDTTAKSGTTYRYTIRCISNDGKAYTSSYDKKGKTITFLSQPSVKVANNSGFVTIKWGKVTGATGYYVYRKTSSGKWKKIKNITSGSTVSYKDTAVKNKNGNMYLYTVKAYSDSYTSSYMSGKKIIRLVTPKISKATNSTGKKIKVSWEKNNSVTGYQIKYVTGSVSKTITIKKASTISKVISGLTKGKTYKIYVRSYKKSSDVNYYSAWSSAKSVKISK